jgi:hypothetical protein
LIVSGGLESNIANTVWFALIGTTQAPVPLQSPDQPAKWLAPIAVGINCTLVFALKLALQALGQFIPAGEELTVPDPDPILLTVSEYTLSNVAWHAWLTSMFKLNVGAAPLQSRDQPLNTLSEAGVAVSATDESTWTAVLLQTTPAVPEQLVSAVLVTVPPPDPVKFTDSCTAPCDTGSIVDAVPGPYWFSTVKVTEPRLGEPDVFVSTPTVNAHWVPLTGQEACNSAWIHEVAVGTEASSKQFDWNLTVNGGVMPSVFAEKMWETLTIGAWVQFWPRLAAHDKSRDAISTIYFTLPPGEEEWHYCGERTTLQRMSRLNADGNDLGMSRPAALNDKANLLAS